MTENDWKVRTNRARRMARRQGLTLIVSRRRDPRALDYGACMLVDRNNNAVLGGRVQANIEDVERYLRGEDA